MDQYKVTYYTSDLVSSHREVFVEADSEYEAICKAQRGSSSDKRSISAKKVFKPTIEDYYKMREKFYIAAGLLVFVSALLIAALVK